MRSGIGRTDTYSQVIYKVEVKKTLLRRPQFFLFRRVGYELCIFVMIWLLAYQGMVLKHNLMIMHESATTGLSTAQITDLQNASSGMWAFAEGNEVMYVVVLLYLIWPMVFNIMGRVTAIMASPETR